MVRAGHLGDAGFLYYNPETGFSPSNLWAENHSWCLCTDYDLWGSKVAGPPALIEALLSDPELEAVRLPWLGQRRTRYDSRFAASYSALDSTTSRTSAPRRPR